MEHNPTSIKLHYNDKHDSLFDMDDVMNCEIQQRSPSQYPPKKS